MSSTLADLEVATCAIAEVVEGTKIGRDGTTLVVSVPELAVGAGEPALAEATVDVVRPGDRVRIANVLDAVVPAVKAADPTSTFPGVAAPRDAPCGSGRTVVLPNVAVLSTCDWRGLGFAEALELPDAFVDMDGPGAALSPWSATSNLVLTFTPAPGAPAAEVDAAIRRATLRAARDLAMAVGPVEDVPLLRVGPRTGDAGGPRVVAIVQVGSEGPLVDTYLYGRPALGQAPAVVDPRVVLDGALTSGAYDWAGVRNPTACYQRSSLILDLLERESAGELTFAGLVVTLGYLDGAEAKRRAAERAAELAASLGADAGVLTTFSSGNSHTDTMLTVRACEARGIATVALVAETNGGLTDHVPEADCLVSVGNEDELVPAWTPDRVIGAIDPATAKLGTSIASVFYMGALTQLGDARLQAVPA